MNYEIGQSVITSDGITGTIKDMYYLDDKDDAGQLITYYHLSLENNEERFKTPELQFVAG